MTRHTMAIDLDSCIGCHSCAVVCKQENNVGLGTFYSKVLTIGPSGTYPDLEMYYLPVACQHCENPQCVSVCPTGASYKRDDGIGSLQVRGMSVLRDGMSVWRAHLRSSEG